ncbi:hypothetical protein COO60DRAFT_623700 [Scenedesmus sp. NREL 46B-D3]|nr:hypothetical protein COO60DRAFT_623700 [Scenedesmus sp. NREL 46B-D3]
MRSMSFMTRCWLLVPMTGPLMHAAGVLHSLAASTCNSAAHHECRKKRLQRLQRLQMLQRLLGVGAVQIKQLLPRLTGCGAALAAFCSLRMLIMLQCTVVANRLQHCGLGSASTVCCHSCSFLLPHPPWRVVCPSRLHSTKIGTVLLIMQRCTREQHVRACF